MWGRILMFNAVVCVECRYTSPGKGTQLGLADVEHKRKKTLENCAPYLSKGIVYK